MFRALPCQGRGRELESLHPHQTEIIERFGALFIVFVMMGVMNIEDIKERSSGLKREAEKLLHDLNLVKTFSRLGEVKRVGSSTTGLILSEDIDFKIYTDNPSGSEVATFAQELLSSSLPVTRIEVTDFDKIKAGPYRLTGVYLGLTIVTDKRWNVDVMIRRKNDTPVHEQEIDELISMATESQKDIILFLKAQLINEKKYSAVSKHPFIYTGADIYRAVIKGAVKDIEGLTDFYAPNP